MRKRKDEEESFYGSTSVSSRRGSANEGPPKPSLVRAPFYGSDSLLNYCDMGQAPEEEAVERSSIDVILEQALFKCSYVIEPVAFIQNLAASIIGISLGQFIYNRIYNRLLDQAAHNSTLNSFYDAPTTCYSNNNNNSSNASLVISYLAHSMLGSTSAPHKTFHQGLSISPADLDAIRNKAQEETANLYFVSALYSGIPVILMTNLLGANCSVLGRKTLMVIYLLSLTIRFFLFLLQCMFPAWPDWVFYVGAFIDGISGSVGVFYLSLYCYLSDLTSPESRSYRITLLNSMNSIASLCVTFLCGYVIKYYGYFYLFLSSVILVLIALLYTILLVPEPLLELHNKSITQRLRSVSIKKPINCFKVFFNRKPMGAMSERSSLLGRVEPKVTSDESMRQMIALLLIVLANFIYNFGTNGIGSIFTLFIMNAPFCFDPIQISKYSVFATVVSLVMSLLVSRFFKVNDVLICILSVASYFASVFCYIYGHSAFYIYLGSVIASIAGLNYSYVRSIVSKSVDKSEVSDALSMILIVDTVIGVLSGIVYPILYSKVVSRGLSLFFAFSNGFVLIALFLNIADYFIYKPVDETQPTLTTTIEVKEPPSQFQPPTKGRLSRSVENLEFRFADDSKQQVGSGIRNPMHSSLMLASIESI